MKRAICTMDWIVTLPDWETKAPPPYRRRSESYWKSVELPLDSERVFVVNTVEDRATRTPARSTALVTTAQLLDFLDRIDPRLVSSAYLIAKSQDENGDALKIHRIKAVRAGDPEQTGWNRIVAIDAEDGLVIMDPDPDQEVHRWANEAEVFRFKGV